MIAFPDTHRSFQRRLALLVATATLAGCAALPISAFAQAGQDSAQISTSAVNLIGWDGAEADSRGQLHMDDHGITFVQNGTPHPVAWSSVRRFAVEHTSRGLIRGAGGMAAGFAPLGAGQLYSAIRPEAQALSLLYVDDHQGLHAAVILLPSDSRKKVLMAFNRAGLQPSALLAQAADAQHDLRLDPSPEDRESVAGHGQQVCVLFPQATTQAMPAAYAAAVYEGPSLKELLDALSDLEARLNRLPA